MYRILLRATLLVVLAISLATGCIYVTFRYLFGDPLDDIAIKQASAQVFLLEHYIDEAPSDEWLTRLNKVREVSGLDAELLPLEASIQQLPATKRTALLKGAVVVDAANKSFYRRVDLAGARYVASDTEVIHAQNLPIDIALAMRMEAIRFVLIALFLLAPIAWWSRAHWRGLQGLSRVADGFGRGDFGARAQVKKSAVIAPLAERMHDMAMRIELLLEARRDLLHAVSHELRTPLARLEFGLELLRDSADNATLNQRADAMQRDVEELNTLVRELLSLTQLDSVPTVSQAAFSVAALLHDCLQALEPHLHKVQLHTDIAEDLGEVNGDQRLYARALGNVLGNAAKYANGRVTLSARRLGDASVVVHIDDDGPGIPVGERSRVFEPFYRLKRDHDHAAAGFGLGLAIAHKAMRLAGGSIAIADGPWGGARFVVTIHTA